MPVQVNINRVDVSIDVSPDTPLLWVLRDTLHHTGTKYGCGIGFCGACTVHIDGRAARACQTPVGTLSGRKVTTIEGLETSDLAAASMPTPTSAKPSLHPVQLAWQALDVPQCGYCQAGQIMAAAALLAETPQPTDPEIDAAMSGNLCRCGTYPRIRQAIHQAATAMAAERKS